MHDEKHCRSEEECCPCCGNEGRRHDGKNGDDRGTALVDEVIGVWQEDFHEACHQLQVEILKPKLRKVWGKSMEGIADQVVTMMHNDWKAAQGDKKAGARSEAFRKELIQKIIAAYSKGPR